jgi:hypothetical protein
VVLKLANVVTEKGREQQDDLSIKILLYYRNGIDYWSLDNAMFSGDVDQLELFPPRLLYRYNGGNNWKCLIEILELI